MKKLLTISLLLLSFGFGIEATLPTSELAKLSQIKCELKPYARSKPHLKLAESTSLNWSGYAAVTNLKSPALRSVTYVQGYWNVPTLKPTPGTAYSATWVGIDGYTSSTVEQIGTEQDWSSGRQQNYAWFEMYPQGAYELVGFPVNNGDSMAATVTYSANGTFELAIYNMTKRVYTVVPSSYTRASNAARSSAEWVVEAPSSQTGVLDLADFSNANFTNCQATINGITGSIKSSRWAYNELVMAEQNGTVKAQPSALNSSGTSFSVTWEHE